MLLSIEQMLDSIALGGQALLVSQAVIIYYSYLLESLAKSMPVKPRHWTSVLKLSPLKRGHLVGCPAVIWSKKFFSLPSCCSAGGQAFCRYCPKHAVRIFPRRAEAVRLFQGLASNTRFSDFWGRPAVECYFSLGWTKIWKIVPDAFGVYVFLLPSNTNCCYFHQEVLFVSPGQTDSQVDGGDASLRKFAKPEPAYGLAMGGQTNSQVGSQVAKRRKFHAYHWLMRFYNNRLLAINLCRLELGGQTIKNLRLLASKFELDQSSRKSTRVGGQMKRKLNASKTCVDFLVRLARGLHTSWKRYFWPSEITQQIYHWQILPIVFEFNLRSHVPT